MCGINGIFAYHYAANPIDKDELMRTRDHMAARGPDGLGAWHSEDGRIGFGHRRLAILDVTEAGAQPMHSADGRYTITYNGEIYNFRQLRQDLEAKGKVFHSQCDTEVLLQLYAEKGPSMVDDLRGMFAFAIWDAHTKKLFLASDPYGIKPLYYADDGWTFRFASQVKALLAGGKISHAQEPAGLVGFYLMGHVPDPFTLYSDIRALPAGATLLVDQTGARTPQSYFSLASLYRTAEQERGVTLAGAQDSVRDALSCSVRHHLVSDVPVGLFLSGGIDSSVLLSLMRASSTAEIQTVTLGFQEFQGQSEDEAPLARAIAERYGTRHTTRLVTAQEFQDDLPKIFDAMDQPSIDGINSWFVAKAARELGLKVCISGLGGDELFGGYPSFQDIPRWVRLLRAPTSLPFVGALARRPLEQVAKAFGLSPKLAGLLQLGGSYAGAYLLRRGLFMPWELHRFLDSAFIDLGLERLHLKRLLGDALRPCPRSDFARISALESCFYMRNQLLRDTDWASMAHGIEVRVPLVDSALVKAIAPITIAAAAKHPGKSLLVAAAQPALPETITKRAKTGFGTPVASWQQHIAVNARPVSMASSRPKFSSGTPWARRWACAVIQA